MSFIKKIFDKEDEDIFSGDENQYYEIKNAEEMAEEGGAKMILLEPRAFSESQQIADHLKKRNTVVVNLKRVTSDQAKRIVDFLSGTIYAIGGGEFSYAHQIISTFREKLVTSQMEKISMIMMILT